jgi:hypothetical protein
MKTYQNQINKIKVRGCNFMETLPQLIVKHFCILDINYSLDNAYNE